MCSKACLLSSIHSLRDQAWQDYRKYQYDPVAGPTHEKYLRMLNEIIEHNEKVESTNE